MSAPTRQHRTCAELGVCQSRPERCPLCIEDPAPWTPDEVTCTPIEQIAYWVCTALLCAITTAAVLGGAGYLYARWIAP